MDVLCVTRYQREYFLALFKHQRKRCDGRVTDNAPTLQGCRYLSAGNFSHNHSIFDYHTVDALFYTMDSLCIACTEVVSPRQHALKCDGCDKWQHRKCKAGNTVITLQEYRVMFRTDETFACYFAHLNNEPDIGTEEQHKTQLL